MIAGNRFPSSKWNNVTEYDNTSYLFYLIDRALLRGIEPYAFDPMIMDPTTTVYRSTLLYVIQNEQTPIDACKDMFNLLQ